MLGRIGRLAIGPATGYAKPMRLLSILPATRLCTMLCIVLALVFAGSTLARAFDNIQHAPGAAAEHEHLLFSDISIETAHDHHHEHDGDEPDQGDESPLDHLSGGHHHHGDGGTGMIVLAAADTVPAAQPDDNPGFVPDRPAIGIKLLGPERPPKIATISA